MNIVVGYIDTPAGEAALAWAMEEAGVRDARLVVIHSKVGGDQDDAAAFAASARALDGVRTRLEDAGIDHSIHEYVLGREPVDDLISAATEHEAAMIVIGIRTRSATGKYLLGSNALEVLHDATVPVVCVKAS